MDNKKGVIVKVIEDHEAPVDKWGRRAELIVSNTPAFRRQIYGALINQSINFVNLHVYDEVKRFVGEGKYKQAWEILTRFYEAVAPDFYNGQVIPVYGNDPEGQCEHLEYVIKNNISVERRSNASAYGVDLIRRLMKAFPDVRPAPVTYIDQLGEKVTTDYPVMITVVHYLLLDKFGTDLNCISFHKRNIHGFPTKLNNNDKYGRWNRNVGDRNTGETEARTEASQVGGEETARRLTLANSPIASRLAIKRIIRSDDPFNIPEVITAAEYKTNRALLIFNNHLSYSGRRLRRQNASDFAS